MTRRRTCAILLAPAAASAVLHRRYGGAWGRLVAGGILIHNAGAYAALTRLGLAAFFRSIASDVASVAPAGPRALKVGCGPGTWRAAWRCSTTSMWPAPTSTRR